MSGQGVRLGRECDQQRARPEQARGEQDRPPDAEPLADPLGGQRRRQRAEVADRERDPDRARGQVELADGVDEQDREDDLAEEVRERRHHHHRPLIRIPEDVAEALTELVPERPALGARRRLLLLADPEQQHGRDRVADRVDEHGDRGGEQCDEAAGHARAGDVRGRTADLELGVRLDDVLSADERGDVGLVGDVEEDGAGADGEADDVELPDRQAADPVDDRHRQERDRPADVAEHEDRLPPQPIDPDACRKREEQEGQELDARQRRDLEGALLEHEDRDERQRQQRDLRPELADRLRPPQGEEVAMPPETARLRVTTRLPRPRA